jgi:hypothetical protein
MEKLLCGVEIGERSFRSELGFADVASREARWARAGEVDCAMK